MSARRRPLLWLIVPVLLLVVVGILLSRAGAPPAAGDGTEDRQAAAAEPRDGGPFESPAAAVARTIRPPGEDEDAPLASREPAGPGIPRTEEIDRLADLAGAGLGARLRMMFDIEEYLQGQTPPAFELLEVSPETLETLLELLSSPDAAVRRDAALRLAAAKLRPQDLPLLRAALERDILSAEEPTARHAVLAMAYALAAQGERFGTERLETAVLSGERAGDDAFRREAVLVLGMVSDPASSPALREILRSDPLAGVRVHAAQGLGRLGGDENLTALAGSLGRDDGVEVRAWAALAYGRAASGDGVQADPLWSSSRADSEPVVRAAALYGLSRAGGPGTSAALLETYHADAETMPRIGIIAALTRRPDLGDRKREFVNTEGSAFLASVARESDDHLELYCAARTLRRIPGETATSALVAILDGESPDWVRNEAARSLARHDGAAALPVLRDRLAAEKRKSVRQALEHEIARLERREREARADR